MIIHPTRTNLLLLKEKSKSISNSISILKARRQALIQEFLNTTVPFLRSREDIRKTYGKALDEMALSLGHEGKSGIESITFAVERDMRVDIIEKSIWGLKYKDIVVNKNPVRETDQRGYDFRSTTPHLEEGIYLFERVLESMLEIAAFENKLKRLADEITRITRKIKVLEERVLIEVRYQIKTITQYIGERDRESYYRLKKFKSSD
ncbi:MAG: V-type ATP synthase subunit D [Thermodesulfovibrionia bacterium]|nr:V-type ATP synthase subunit D [Thermodesulfovibrionia bacterium]